MKLHTKALYNLLRSQWLKDPSLSVQPWQVEDYREFSTHELFDSLTALGLSLSEEDFLLYSENYENPEKFVDFIWPHLYRRRPETLNFDSKILSSDSGMESEANLNKVSEIECSHHDSKDTEKKSKSQADGDINSKDHAYLLIFELWRRLLSEKHSLSTFCDELDYRIELYEKDPSFQKGGMESILNRLEEVLGENTDEGEEPKAVFYTLSLYCAHDIESFLYDYISDQIDSGHPVYASELLEAFYPYLSDTLWFDLLRARLLAATDPHEVNLLLKAVLEKLKAAPDLDLLLEIASFLTSHGDPHLFHQAIRQTLDHVLTEEDFQELLAITADYYSCCDMEKEETAVQNIFTKRVKYDPEAPLDRSDKDIIAFSGFLGEVMKFPPWE